MLALDNTLRHIETSESDVLDLFQSSPVPVNLAGSRPEPRSAYICAVKKKNNVQVYVALAAEHGRNFVYTGSGSGDSATSYQDSLERALAFARSMGFTPERVNLEYGPAMRAVVVRNFKIFNFPGNGKKATVSGPSLAHQKLPAPQEEPAGASSHGAPAAPIALAASVASVASAVTAAVASVSATAKSAAKGNDKDEHKEAITDLILKFGTEMAELRAERDELAVTVQELSAARLGIVAELDLARTENRKLVAQRDQAAGSAAAVAKATSELAAALKKIDELSRERDDSRRRSEDLVAENNALAEAAARKEEELARTKQEAAEVREAASGAKESAVSAAEEIAKAAGDAAAKAKDEATKARVEAAKAKEEAAKAKEEAAKAKEEAAKAQDEAAKAQDEAERAIEEAAKAREELKKVQEEAARIRKEAAKLAKERDLSAKRAEELAQGTKSAGREVEELQAKVDSISAERDAALSLAEKLEQQASASGVERDAARSELAALVAACEKVLGLATERASVVAALPKAAAAAVPEEAEAETESVTEIEVETVADAVAATEVEAEVEEALEEAEIETETETVPDVPAEAGSEPNMQQDVEAEVQTCEEIQAVRGTAKAAEEAEVQTDPEIEVFEAAASVVAKSPEPVEKAAKVVSRPEPESQQPARTPAATPGFDSFTEAAVLPDFGIVHPLPAQSDFTTLPFAGFGAADGFFGDFSDGETGIFLLNKGQAAIEYSSPEDVVQLHKSYNIANVAPDGEKQERCEGYICCVRSQGQLQTYAAIYGTETGRVGVYVPEVQQSDEQGIAAAVAGAVTFHEQVGLMIELADHPSPQKLTTLLEKCPVLKLVS